MLEHCVSIALFDRVYLVGGRSPSFKYASHETQHFTSYMSADSVHLRSCVNSGHGSWSRSGCHAPAQSVSSPRCGRPLAPHHLLSPSVALANSGQGFTTALQRLRPRRCIADFRACAPAVGRNQRRLRLHVRLAWLVLIIFAELSCMCPD